MDASAPASRKLFSRTLLGYLLADVAGMILIALGGSYLVTGSPLLLLGVPQTFLGSLLFIIAGFILMLWALARVLVVVASHNQQQVQIS